MLIFHLSITNATATDSVIKTDTKKKTHIPLLRLIDQTLNTEMIILNYPLTIRHYTTDIVKNNLLRLNFKQPC